MTGATLDAGALIAVDRGDPRVTALLREAGRHGLPLSVPAAALAQAWRDGARQARLSRLVTARTVEIVPLDGPAARAVGVVCGVAGVQDVVDVSVVLCARRRGHTVVTSDPVDLARIDPSLPILAV